MSTTRHIWEPDTAGMDTCVCSARRRRKPSPSRSLHGVPTWRVDYLRPGATEWSDTPGPCTRPPSASALYYRRTKKGAK